MIHSRREWLLNGSKMSKVQPPPALTGEGRERFPRNHSRIEPMNPLFVVPSKMRLSLRMLALVAAGYLAWVAVQSFRPAPGPADVSVTLLGYTNSPSGNDVMWVSCVCQSLIFVVIWLDMRFTFVWPSGIFHRRRLKTARGTSRRDLPPRLFLPMEGPHAKPLQNPSVGF